MRNVFELLPIRKMAEKEELEKKLGDGVVNTIRPKIPYVPCGHFHNPEIIIRPATYKGHYAKEEKTK